MKLELDTIQFESRNEIRTIITALEEWQEEWESKEGKNTIVQELINKLETMDMCW